MEKCLRWFWKPTMGHSRRVDETYVKVKGKWTYLYRVIDKRGHSVDVYLSSTRDMKAAKRFLGKALKSIKPWGHPQAINTDKVPTFGPANQAPRRKQRGINCAPTIRWLSASLRPKGRGIEPAEIKVLKEKGNARRIRYIAR